MFTNNFPYFKKGNVLKQGMLENLRDYPRNFFNFYFKNYTSGIISGSELVVEQNNICIRPGIIKFNDLIYILDEAKKINYSNDNQEVMVKIKFLASRDTNSFAKQKSKVFLDKNISLKGNEFELARFKLREGAQLRTAYNQFEDFQTEYNTINIINVKYANVDKFTIHPLIVNKFAKKLLQKSEDDSLDLTFAMQCLNNRVINRDLLINYLVRKLNLREKDYTNLEIYNYLNKVLKNLSGSKRRQPQQNQKLNKIIVD